MITLKGTWGRMISCGRLAIGLARFVPSSKPITNHLLQRRAAPHTRQTTEIKSDAPKYGFVPPNLFFGRPLKRSNPAQPSHYACHLPHLTRASQHDRIHLNQEPCK